MLRGLRIIKKNWPGGAPPFPPEASRLEIHLFSPESGADQS